MATTDVQLRPRPIPRPINPDRRHTVVVGLKTSKFRHVAVTSGGKEGTFINLRQVNTRLRPESNGFAINNRWAAVPLSVAGGVVAIFDLRKPTKIADGVIPGLENGANVADFAWYPFDQDTLVVACDNGVVNFWTIPQDGIYSIQSTPTKTFKAHSDRINVIKFNPVAADVLATAANNGEIIIWDTGALEPKIHLQTSANPILAMAWSSDGKYLAVVSRDCFLRVYEPRANNIPLLESHVLETPKGARVLFVCNDRFLLTSSLTKSSQRTINLYSASNLALAHSHPLDTSSSLLIPHYDFDSSVVFLTGKGDRTIHMFEICEESPHFLPLSPFAAPNSHQAIAFVSKNAVNVRKVEFARGARLMLSEVENMTFTVPRVKMDYFQNDLFPPSLMTWESSASANEWFQNGHISRKFLALKPDDMEPLYKDMYVHDMTRQASAPGTPIFATKPTPIPEAKNHVSHVEENGAKAEENGKQDNDNGDITDSVFTEENAHMTVTKRASDGLTSWPPSEMESPSSNKAALQQPKRLSIDPNCGTPLRDLLRRCDEIPGVIAMRKDSDEAENGTEAPEVDQEWE